MRFDRFLSLSTRSKKLDPDRTFVKLSSIIRPGVHWRRRITQGERRTFDDGAESCLLGEGCIVVGADTLTVEVLPAPDHAVHQFLLFESGVPLLENMCLTDKAIGVTLRLAVSGNR